MHSLEPSGIDCRISACPLCKDHVTQSNVLLYRSACSHTNGFLYSIETEQFVYINWNRGLSHSSSLDGDLLSIVGSCKAIHSTYFIVAVDVLEESLCNKLGPKRVTGKQYCLRYGTIGCIDMCTHRIKYNMEKDIMQRISDLQNEFILKEFFKFILTVLR